MSPPTSIPGLTSGTTFCYRFLAYNVAGDSAYSNKACGTTPSGLQPDGSEGGDGRRDSREHAGGDQLREGLLGALPRRQDPRLAAGAVAARARVPAR